MGTLTQDLRYAARILRRAPGFTAAAVFTLGLGIGANSALFSILNAVLLQPLPYRDPNTLVILAREGERGSSPRAIIRPSEFVQWRDRVRSIEHLTATVNQGFALTGVETPEEIQGNLVSANVFLLLGVEPLIGRRFLAPEYNPGGPPVVVLSHRLWQRRFHGDPNILSRTITLNGERAAVVGVLPPGFYFPAESSEVWAPLRLDAEQTGGGRMRRFFSMQVFGRLRPGFTLAQAQAEIKIAGAQEDPLLPAADRGRSVQVRPALEHLVSNVRPTLLVLAGSVGLILLIGCANVANLLLARATGRQREVAVRAALGAGRGRLLRQLLTESVFLAVLGGMLGLALAFAGLPGLVAFLTDAADIPRLLHVRVDFAVVLFTLAVSGAVGVLFGLVPAWHGSRIDLSEALKQGGGRTAASRPGARFRGLLVIAQVALSLILLIGAGLMIRSTLRLQAIDLGFRPDHLLTMPIPSARSGGFPTGPAIEVVEQLLGRVGRIPGVESASVVNVLPLADLRTMTGFRVAGQPEPAREEDRRIGFSYVSSGYFSAMRIPLVGGRTFTNHDRAGAPRVGMINESAARRFFPQQQPVGQFLVQGPGSSPIEIVGVVKDIKLRLLDDEGGPFLFLPYLQAGGQRLPAFLVVRTTTAPLGKLALVRDEVRAVAPDQVIPEIQTMEQRIARVIADRRLLTVLLGCLAGVALVMAATGVFGSVSYTVGRRTHEIGVRVALGARPADVLRMIVGQALLQVSIGVVGGAGGAVALTRFLAARLYGVTATDPVTFASVSALLLLVAAAAGYIPARRATSVDPVVTLRNE